MRKGPNKSIQFRWPATETPITSTATSSTTASRKIHRAVPRQNCTDMRAVKYRPIKPMTPNRAWRSARVYELPKMR